MTDDDMIAASSLGTPGARELRERGSRDLSEYLTMMARRVEEEGWMIQAVFPSSPQEFPFQPFQYTVGLFPKAGYELIVVGLPHNTGGALLNSLASTVVAQQNPASYCRHGMIVRGLLAGSYATMLIRATATEEYITVARALYPTEGPMPAFQLIFPDVDDLWPWEEGSKVSAMTLLGEAP